MEKELNFKKGEQCFRIVNQDDDDIMISFIDKIIYGSGDVRLFMNDILISYILEGNFLDIDIELKKIKIYVGSSNV